VEALAAAVDCASSRRWTPRRRRCCAGSSTRCAACSAPVDEQPHDELEELTGLQTGPSTRPDDPVLARLLPDFATDDSDLSGALRSLHEPS
jgi:hypothetical protein